MHTQLSEKRKKETVKPHTHQRNLRKLKKTLRSTRQNLLNSTLQDSKSEKFVDGSQWQRVTVLLIKAVEISSKFYLQTSFFRP